MKTNSFESILRYSVPEYLSRFDRQDRFKRAEEGESLRMLAGKVESHWDEKCLLPGRENRG